MKKIVTAVCAAVLVSTMCAILAWASPAVGVTPTPIGRATYEPFKVETEPDSLVDVQVKAKSHLDVVVRTHDYAAGGSTGSLPDWIANPAEIPPGLKGQNNCTFPIVPGGTGGIWNYHTDGACWERPGPDGWIRQQQNVVHAPQHAACGGGAADVSPIRICRTGGAGQPTPCDVNPTTGPLGCAICVRSVVCH